MPNREEPQANPRIPAPFVQYAHSVFLGLSQQDPFEIMRYNRRATPTFKKSCWPSNLAMHITCQPNYRNATRDTRTWQCAVRFDWSEHQIIQLPYASLPGSWAVPVCLFCTAVEPQRTGVRLLASWINQTADSGRPSQRTRTPGFFP
jgi:hypothetical protein